MKIDILRYLTNSFFRFKTYSFPLEEWELLEILNVNLKYKYDSKNYLNRF